MTDKTFDAQDESEQQVLSSMSIYQRMAAILSDLPSVGKKQKNAQQNFMYRGHDDVLNALNPLLSKYGVFFVPHVIERITDQRKTKSGSVMYEVNLLVEYTFYGADGTSIVASSWGEGTDSGDKSTNKAMTMALKNVLAQTFAVSTEEQSLLDTDQHTDEPTSRVVARDVRMRSRITDMCRKVDALQEREEHHTSEKIEDESQRVFGAAFSDLKEDELAALGKEIGRFLDWIKANPEDKGATEFNFVDG